MSIKLVDTLLYGYPLVRTVYPYGYKRNQRSLRARFLARERRFCRRGLRPVCVSSAVSSELFGAVATWLQVAGQSLVLISAMLTANLAPAQLPAEAGPPVADPAPQPQPESHRQNVSACSSYAMV